MSTLAKPTIHINGTHKDTLLDAHCDAMTAIRKAMDAMEEIAPNGRDYYIQDPSMSALRVAQSEHNVRVNHLRAVLAELEEIAEHIADS